MDHQRFLATTDTTVLRGEIVRVGGLLDELRVQARQLQARFDEERTYFLDLGKRYQELEPGIKVPTKKSIEANIARTGSKIIADRAKNKAERENRRYADHALADAKSFATERALEQGLSELPQGSLKLMEKAHRRHFPEHYITSPARR